MDQITIKNFRCFREEQSARLAPLTLLVGENSTGKTSFMAMIRALVDLASSQVPDFKESPYDLGSFDEIIHNRGGKSYRAGTFEAGFNLAPHVENGNNSDDEPVQFSVTFGRNGTTPFPIKRRFAQGDAWLEEHLRIEEPYKILVGTRRGTWEKQMPGRFAWFDLQENRMPPPFLLLRISFSEDDREESTDFKPLQGTNTFSSGDRELIEDLALSIHHLTPRPYASAPVRSKPRRTYDPSRPTPDPEGDNVPMYLADLFFQNKESWGVLEERLEEFGKDAGLFNEISIRPLGKRGSEPFQVQLRKFGSKLKGGPRNLSDMGYGVSQVLPIITELLRPDAPSMFLFQQPEVHLHPSAQAALGSLFCQVAGPERQLVVETHSDHILDRVRMDIRDSVGRLKPDDVSILFFERGDLDVHIHSLGIDEEGNVVGAPHSYRRFFMQETERSLGL